MKIGVLVSGAGTNLAALLAAQQTGRLAPAEIVLVLSNCPGVPALDRAQAAGVPAALVDHRNYPDRTAFESALLERLRVAGVEAVVLAGFLRVLSDHFISAFPNRIINTHPALSPAFPGMHAPAQALAYGVKVTGCTIHLVDNGVDTGPILFQASVPIEPDDTPQQLQARIQVEEHRLLPEAVRLLASGKLTVEGRKVHVVV
jgi:phosphoribosylglycinamide formyltransferase-1